MAGPRLGPSATVHRPQGGAASMIHIHSGGAGSGAGFASAQPLLVVVPVVGAVSVCGSVVMPLVCEAKRDGDEALGPNGSGAVDGGPVG